METANLPDLTIAMEDSITPKSFRDVQNDRNNWTKQRKYLNKIINLTYSLEPTSSGSLVAEESLKEIIRVHFVTYSSEDNDDLKALLASAFMSGIELEA